MALKEKGEKTSKKNLRRLKGKLIDFDVEMRHPRTAFVSLRIRVTEAKNFTWDDNCKVSLTVHKGQAILT